MPRPYFCLTPGHRRLAAWKSCSAARNQARINRRPPRLFLNRQTKKPGSFGSTKKQMERFGEFYRRLVSARLGGTYEAAHTELILDCARVVVLRQERLKTGNLPPLPAAAQIAADDSYVMTVTKLCSGFESLMQSYEHSPDRTRRKIFRYWRDTGKKPYWRTILESRNLTPWSSRAVS